MNMLKTGWMKLAAALGGMVALGGIVALGVALTGGGSGDDGKSPYEPVDISGRWKIGYYDTALGRVVNGVAFINKDQSAAEVVLVHPQDLKEYRFSTENFAYSDRNVSFDLVGDWPGAAEDDFHIAEEVEVAKAASAFTIRLGETSESFEAKRSETEPEENVVHIEMTVTQQGMTGTWEFIADAQTGREKDGNGRVGQFTLNDDGSATQKERESWWRPEPEILLTIPADDQRDEVYEHPDGAGRNYRELVVLGVDLPIPEKENVTIESFDDQVEYKLRSLGDDADIPGSVLWRAFKRLERTQPETYAKVRANFDAKKISALLIEARLDNDALPGLTHYAINRAEGSWLLQFADYVADISFVRKVSEKPEELAEEEEGIPLAAERENPITLPIEIDGEVEEIELAPPPREKPKAQALYEPAWMAYYPEEVYVQIATTRELPYDKIPLRLAVDGKATAFIVNSSGANRIGKDSSGKEGEGGRRSIDDAPVKTAATNTGLADKDAFASVIYAVKSPDNPRQYLTPPIALVGPGKPIEAAYSADALFSQQPITPNSNIIALVDHKDESFVKDAWHFAMVSPMARTVIEPRPSDKGLSKTDYVLTWPRAVSEAAQCYPSLTVEDYEKDAVKVVDSFSHYIVNAWAVKNVDFHRKTDLLLGDHAAMLLLRDTFIDMMRRHSEEMQQVKQNPYGFYQAMLPFGSEGENSGKRMPPILRMLVHAPDGSEIKLFEILGSEQHIYERFGVMGKAAKEWQEKAIIEAIDLYIPQVEEALGKAWRASDCNVQELIAITGKGFYNVVGQTFPRLMRVSGHTGLWEPDRAARAWAMNLNILVESLDLEAQLASQDTQLMLFEGAMFFAIPAAINLAAGGAAWAVGVSAPEIFVSTALTSAANAIIDVSEFGYAVYNSYQNISGLNKELDFAAKSAAVIGYDRYDEAKDKEYETYLNAKIDIMFASAGMLAGADDIVKTFRNVQKPGEALKGIAESYLKFKEAPKQWLGNQFKPWPTYSNAQALKTGKIIYARLSQKFKNLWEKSARFFQGAPKTSPAILAQIKEAVLGELRQQRKLYEAVQQDSKYLKNLLKDGRITAKQFHNFTSRLKEGARFFPDPDAIPLDQLDALIGRVADDIFEEGAKYGLKQEVMLSRAAKRIKGVITSPDVYEGFLGRVGKPRLVSAAEASQLTPQQLSALSEMYDEVMKLSQADRELVILALQRALKQGEIAGVKALKPEIAMSYRLAQYIVEEAAKKPRWAQALSIEEYAKVKDMFRRVDIRQMLAEDADGLRAMIRDPVALDVLRGEPFQTTGALRKAVDQAKKRIKNAISGVYESASPKLKNPKGFQVKVSGNRERGFVNLVIYYGKKSIGRFSRHLETIGQERKFFGKSEDYAFMREFADDDKMFVMKVAMLDIEDGVPNMIKSAKNPMIKGKGTPIATYLNMRAMQEFGIPFADPKLKICKLDHVLNKKTALQLDWLKRVYPDKSIDELLQYTHSYQYAESALTQAGYRIRKAILRAASDEYKIMQDAWGGAASFGKEGELAFINRYGYVDPDAIVDAGHDFFLLLEPLTK